VSPARASFGDRLFRALLYLLPKEMRDRDGREIAAMFADEWDVRRRRGGFACIALLVAASMDIARRAPYEHWRRRDHGTIEDFSMRSFLSDFRFAIRSFSRQPGPTSLIILTLALGIAANTAVFAIVDGLFLRPFPFPQPERLVYLNERAPKWNLELTGINYPDFDTWRGRTHLFDGMALYTGERVNLADGAVAERVDGLSVTYDFAKVLGIQPVLGRTFTKEEDGPTTSRVVMIGYGLWQSRFAGSRDVLGKSLRINSVPYSIIGVLPREADFPGGVQFWLTLNGDPNQNGQSYSYEGIGRLKRGVTVEQARADLETAHAPIWAQFDSAHVVSPRIAPLREQFVSNYSTMGEALGAGALVVLLIACANVAGAMLARSIFRQREIGIRMALGASARRVGRQMLTESLAIAAIAGIAGTLLGRWGLRAIVAAATDQIPGWVRLDASGRTIVFAGMVIVVTAIVFGLVPALQARRADVAGSIASGGSATRTTAGLPQRRMLDSLVVIEVALALVLLVGSGLLVRAYSNLRDTDPGFRPEGVTTFSLALPTVRYPDGIVQEQFFARLLDRLNTTSGISSAGLVTCLPFGCHWGRFVRAEGAPPPTGNGSNPVVLVRYASEVYFKTMGIRLVRGRIFQSSETEPGVNGKQHPAVINEQLAKQLWPDGTDPIGRRFSWNGDTSTADWMTVVGVVKDVRHYGLVKPMIGGMYLSSTDVDKSSRFAYGVAIRSSGEPATVAKLAREIVRALDPEVPLIQLQTAGTALARSLAPRRTIAFAFAAFGAVALALALGGIYAVLSYVVGRRRQEIGIRMALGARRGQVLRLVVGQGLRLVIFGVVIGLPLALLALGQLSSLLVGISARDPITYVVAVALLGGTAVVSALVPARRAAGVDPKTALGDS
jgi:putative ABC transport system permease protein